METTVMDLLITGKVETGKTTFTLYLFTLQRPSSGGEGNKCLKYFSTDSSVRAARIKGT